MSQQQCKKGNNSDLTEVTIVSNMVTIGGGMVKGRPSPVGRNRVSVRVLMPKADYETLKQIAELERTDISTLVRRAVAHHFFISGNSNAVKVDRVIEVD